MGISGNFQSPFDGLRLQMNDVLGDGGILKQVVQPGVGAPIPCDASVLSITLRLYYHDNVVHLGNYFVLQN